MALEIERKFLVEQLPPEIAQGYLATGEDQVAAFSPPPWLALELTGDEWWSNQRLALDGLPTAAR